MRMILRNLVAHLTLTTVLSLPIPASPAQAVALPERSGFRHPDSSDDLDWKAAFIGVTRPAEPNQWIAFRKSFRLAETPLRPVARVAADTKYWLWINDVLVVRDGGLKQGPKPTDTYYDEIPLTPHLRPGINTIAVLLWHLGKQGFSHKDSGRAGLLVQIEDGEHLLLGSDKSWRVCLHPAFGNTAEPHPNFRLPESNIRFDAREDLAGWTGKSYDDHGWSLAVEFGRAPCAPWNRLVRRPIPLWRDSARRSYDRQIERAADGIDDPLPPSVTGTRRQVVGELPYNAAVTPYLKVAAAAGLLIDIRTDNYKGGGSPNVRAEYVTREGVQEFECFGWMNGHAVEYTLPREVRVLEIGYRETGFDTDWSGKFVCDDPFLNRLREKAARTLYLTMRDTYMDCPDRERSQWWGDVVNELGEVFYALDRRADRLTRKGMLELAGWQKTTGVLFSPVPAGNWDKDLPLQMLASVGEKGFWTYALFSGDLATLRAVYPAVQRYLEIWDLQPNGLIVPRAGAWAWGDWGDNIDMTTLAQVWYYLALRGQRAAAVALERPADLKWLDVRLASVRAAFRTVHWQGREYRAADHRGETDDRANALAVVAGLATPEQYEALTALLTRQRQASPYMEKYVLEALCLMGQEGIAQRRMKERYGAMVNHPKYSTLWEGWEIGSDRFGGGTVNHAWSGGPLTIMSQYFAGIAPSELGFAAYWVLPQPGYLRDIQAEFDSVRGRIAVHVTIADRETTLTLHSPQGTRAVVGIPVPPGRTVHSITVNGDPLWSRTDAGLRHARISFQPSTGQVGRHLMFTVPPGDWTFAARIGTDSTP